MSLILLDFEIIKQKEVNIPELLDRRLSSTS